MYIKRILRVLIPGSPCPCRTPRIPVSFVSRVPVSGDLEHYLAMEYGDYIFIETRCEAINSVRQV